MPLSPHVSKFGGTSVATPERIRRVVDLVAAQPAGGRRVVVVSALGGTTDDLLAALDAGLARKGHTDAVAAIRERTRQRLTRSPTPTTGTRSKASSTRVSASCPSCSTASRSCARRRPVRATP